jgi:hypothetical protein
VSLTDEQLVVACRNIGYDLTCGACAMLFYTGYTGPTSRFDALPSEHTCEKHGRDSGEARRPTPQGERITDDRLRVLAADGDESSLDEKEQMAQGLLNQRSRIRFLEAEKRRLLGEKRSASPRLLTAARAYLTSRTDEAREALHFAVVAEPRSEAAQPEDTEVLYQMGTRLEEEGTSSLTIHLANGKTATVAIEGPRSADAPSEWQPVNRDVLYGFLREVADFIGTPVSMARTAEKMLAALDRIESRRESAPTDEPKPLSAAELRRRSPAGDADRAAAEAAPNACVECHEEPVGVQGARCAKCIAWLLSVGDPNEKVAPTPSKASDDNMSVRALAIRWLSTNGVFSPQRVATLVILLERVRREGRDDGVEIGAASPCGHEAGPSSSVDWREELVIFREAIPAPRAGNDVAIAAFERVAMLLGDFGVRDFAKMVTPKGGATR